MQYHKSINTLRNHSLSFEVHYLKDWAGLQKNLFYIRDFYYFRVKLFLIFTVNPRQLLGLRTSTVRRCTGYPVIEKAGYPAKYAATELHLNTASLQQSTVLRLPVTSADLM